MQLEEMDIEAGIYVILLNQLPEDFVCYFFRPEDVSS